MRSVKGCKIRDFGGSDSLVHLSTANSVLILENAMRQDLTLTDSLSCNLNASLHCHSGAIKHLHCDSTNLLTNCQLESKVWNIPLDNSFQVEPIGKNKIPHQVYILGAKIQTFISLKKLKKYLFIVSVAFLKPNSVLSLTQNGKLSLNGRLLQGFKPQKEGLFTSLSVCCIILCKQKCWIICVTSMHEISLWLLEDREEAGYSVVVVPLAFLCLDSSSPNGGKPLCSSVHRSSSCYNDRKDGEGKKVTLLIGHDDGFYRKVVGDIMGKQKLSTF